MAMIKILLCLFIVFVSSPIYAASRVYLEDFESSNWTDSFRSGTTNAARVNNHNYAGAYCLRGNLKEGLTDPIANVAGENNPILEFDGDGIIAATASQATGGQVYVSYWRRFDNANWRPCTVDCGKGEYITDSAVGTSAFYTRLNTSGTNNAVISDNGNWYSWCRDNWGYQKAYFTSPAFGVDGTWHHVEYLVDYDNDTMEIWVDNIKFEALPDSSSDGYFTDKLPIPPDFTMRGIQFFYVAPTQVEDSTDNGSEYACGWQIDDIEVWDGLPNGITVEPSTYKTKGSFNAR